MRLTLGICFACLALLGMGACSATSASGGNENDKFATSPSPTASGTAGELPPTDPSGARADAGSVPMPFAEQGVVVVNASRRVPAFRICKADATVDASNSQRRPFPTTRMPGSSLAGVDINGAVRLDPADSDVADIGADTSVLVLFIDADTKNTRDLPAGSCKQLACPGGGVCFPQAKLRRAEVRKAGAKLANGFRAGQVLVLRDDPANSTGVYFDATDMPFQGSGKGAIRFEYSNFSDVQAKLTFTQGSQVDDFTPGVGNVVSPTSFDSELSVGSLTVSLAALHGVSEPATDINAFYGTGAAMGLYLLGIGAPAAGDEARALKLVAVPFAKPAAATSADAGADAQ